MPDTDATLALAVNPVNSTKQTKGQAEVPKSEGIADLAVS